MFTLIEKNLSFYLSINLFIFDKIVMCTIKKQFKKRADKVTSVKLHIFLKISSTRNVLKENALLCYALNHTFQPFQFTGKTPNPPV